MGRPQDQHALEKSFHSLQDKREVESASFLFHCELEYSPETQTMTKEQNAYITNIKITPFVWHERNPEFFSHSRSNQPFFGVFHFEIWSGR
jgi:hypothetical protein